MSKSNNLFKYSSLIISFLMTNNFQPNYQIELTKSLKRIEEAQKLPQKETNLEITFEEISRLAKQRFTEKKPTYFAQKICLVLEDIKRTLTIQRKTITLLSDPDFQMSFGFFIIIHWLNESKFRSKNPADTLEKNPAIQSALIEYIELLKRKIRLTIPILRYQRSLRFVNLLTLPFLPLSAILSPKEQMIIKLVEDGLPAETYWKRAETFIFKKSTEKSSFGISSDAVFDHFFFSRLNQAFQFFVAIVFLYTNQILFKELSSQDEKTDFYTADFTGLDLGVTVVTEAWIEGVLESIFTEAKITSILKIVEL